MHVHKNVCIKERISVLACRYLDTGVTTLKLFFKLVKHLLLQYNKDTALEFKHHKEIHGKQK